MQYIATTIAIAAVILISLFGDANSPCARCTILKGICPTRFAVKININKVSISGLCFLDSASPILPAVIPEK